MGFPHATGPLLLIFVVLRAVLAQDACPQAPTLSDIASNCTAYHTVVDGDSCDSLEKTFDITLDEFLSWNPSVSEDCLTNFWIGEAYCVGVGTQTAVCTTSSTAASIGGGSTSLTSSNSARPTITPTSTTSSSTWSVISTTANATYSTRWPVTTWNVTTVASATAWPPERTQAGQPSNCKSWHLVTSGDTCDTVVNAAEVGVTLALLLEWNPTLGDDCSGLYVGWWVCDGISSNGSVTLTWSATATNASVPAATPYTSSSSTSVDFAFTAEPTQTGIPDSCQAYYLAVADDTCTTVLALYTYITEAQFFDWNPALDGACDSLWAGYYYCVANFDSSSVPMPTVTTTPAQTAAGETSSCTAWYNTTTGDTCERISGQFGTFSASDFISWNPSILSTCNGLELGIYYCVAVTGTPTTRTAAYSTTSTAAATASTLSASCSDAWFVGADDDCTIIAESNGLALAEFVALNPQLSATSSGDCDVTVNSYVCVAFTTNDTSVIFSGGPTTSTASTTIGGGAAASSSSLATTTGTTTTMGASSTAVSTPSPVQDGMVDGCVRFYFAESNDNCYDIAVDAGIALDDFYEWNPALNGDCTGLWAEEYYCIGTLGPATTITSGTPVPATETATA